MYGADRRVCHRRSTGCLSCDSIVACSRSTITLILHTTQAQAHTPPCSRQTQTKISASGRRFDGPDARSPARRCSLLLPALTFQFPPPIRAHQSSGP